MSRLPVALLAALVVLLAAATTATAAILPPPSAEMNLDLPAADRWNATIAALLARHSFADSIGAVLSFYSPVLLLLPANTTQRLAVHIMAQYPNHYAEMLGISSFLWENYQEQVSIADLAGMFYLYELGHINTAAPHLKQMARSCTGILSLPHNKNDPILHGRNMDESPIAGRNLTMHVTVTKGGLPQYEIFDWTWLTTGFYTSSRFGGVTLEMNWRNQGEFTFEDVFKRIMNPEYHPIAYVFRRIQEQQLQFPAAVDYVANHNNVVGCYVIMSGTARQGAIITVDSNKAKTRREFLNDTSSVTFKVQTNYDRWLPDPPTDPRRTVAEETLMAQTRIRRGTELGLFMALSTYPVHNRHTMFTALMSAEHENIEGYVRDPMYPSTVPW